MDHKGLTNAYLLDLVADIRTARKFQKEYPQYLANQLQIERDATDEFRRLWKHRHGATIGKFGIPKAEGQG